MNDKAAMKFPPEDNNGKTTLPVYKNDFQVFDDRNTVFFPNEARLPFYFRTLIEICHAEGIGVELLSDGWVLKLSLGGKIHYIFGYKFGINNQAAGQIADDKFATFSILRSANVPIIDQTIFYNSNNKMPYAKHRNSPEYVAEYLHSYNDHIVIKPTTGTCGQNVIQITRELEIPNAFEKVLQQSHSAVMCPFYQIQHEYRIIMLDGEPRLSYMKSLSADFSNWKFNLKTGAEAAEITDQEKKKQITEIARRAVGAIGLRFCSVDIIETYDHQLFVMEVNSGVMIKRYLLQHPEKYSQIYNLYRDVIIKMFQA